MNYIQENIKNTIDFTLNIMALSIEDEKYRAQVFNAPLDNNFILFISNEIERYCKGIVHEIIEKELEEKKNGKQN